jgi:hypothetical protein
MNSTSKYKRNTKKLKIYLISSFLSFLIIKLLYVNININIFIKIKKLPTEKFKE